MIHSACKSFAMVFRDWKLSARLTPLDQAQKKQTPISINIEPGIYAY